MNLSLKMSAIAVLGCAIILVGGCASSSLVKIWHDPSYQAPPLKTMLVIAARKDGEKRHIWEDAFSGELARHGVAATPSYRFFPDHLPDTGQVISLVKQGGFGGIMIIRKLPSKIHLRFVPAYLDHSSFWPDYSECYSEAEPEWDIDTLRVDFRAIDVIATDRGGHLIWRATSKTRYPVMVRDVYPDIARKVTAELAHGKIISPEN
jgi:hypothetical protein